MPTGTGSDPLRLVGQYTVHSFEGLRQVDLEQSNFYVLQEPAELGFWWDRAGTGIHSDYALKVSSHFDRAAEELVHLLVAGWDTEDCEMKGWDTEPFAEVWYELIRGYADLLSAGHLNEHFVASVVLVEWLFVDCKVLMWRSSEQAAD